MTTSTLSAASAALNSLLSAGNLAPSVSKPRRKKTNAKRSTDIADTADLDPAARAQREAEGQKKVDEAVKALRRSGTVKKEELEVRERILAMRDEKAGKKKGTKRKAVVEDDSD